MSKKSFREDAKRDMAKFQEAQEGVVQGPQNEDPVQPEEKPKKKARKQSELPQGVARFTTYLREADINHLKAVSEILRVPMYKLMQKAVKEYLKNNWTPKQMKEAEEKFKNPF